MNVSLKTKREKEAASPKLNLMLKRKKNYDSRENTVLPLWKDGNKNDTWRTPVDVIVVAVDDGGRRKDMC